MSEPNFKLANPPIVEAVLDIDCDLPPDQQVAALEKPARDFYTDRYPKSRAQFLQQHQLEVKPGEPPHVSTGHKIVQALLFLQEDEKQLIQVRPQGYSFNRLAPYTGLDDYAPEIERTWRLYVSLASPVQIRSIRLRYINRVLLPIKCNHVDLDQYLQIGPRLPDEDKLSFVGFLNQQSMVDRDTGNQVSLVLTSQLPEGEKLPIIFDNCVSAPQQGSPDDWAWIYAKIVELRALKNRIFKRTLTEECMNLFR